jgi:hypothetical protein
MTKKDYILLGDVLADNIKRVGTPVHQIADSPSLKNLIRALKAQNDKFNEEFFISYIEKKVIKLLATEYETNNGRSE